MGENIIKISKDFALKSLHKCLKSKITPSFMTVIYQERESEHSWSSSENPGAKKRPAHVCVVCIFLNNENVLMSSLFNFKTLKNKVINFNHTK